MGHQLTRTAAAAAVAIVAASCGGSGGDGDATPVLDIAREQVEVTAPDMDDDGGDAVEAVDAFEDPDRAADGEDDEPAELPPPDPSTFEGANRVVNLWVGPDGDTTPIDVWGRRTFTNGPVLLAEDIAFGEVSEYFTSPPGYSLVIVGADAGPDGSERAGLFNAADGEQITTVYTNADDRGTVGGPNLYERGVDQAPEPPAEGTGLVLLATTNLSAFSDSLTASVGGSDFYVGDGTGSCRVQRAEGTGAAPDILGGTQRVELELDPGPTTISFHPWFSPDECDQPSVLDLTLDVEPDATTLVLLYSRDGATVDALALPVAAGG